MKNPQYLAKFVLGLMAFLTTPMLALATPAIERVEPPNWWVGMKSGELQLMLHGINVANNVISLSYPGVQIESITRTANSNYAFVNLRIAPNTVPGTVSIELRDGTALQRVPYELLAREAGSHARKGFNSSDAILNLMPDRFANGDLSNDNQPGFADVVARSNTESGRHGGDLAGLIQHLDYIAGMGFTAIWPTPFTENNQPQYSYHGYAATDTYRIDPRFGSNADYRRMVRLAKAKGIGVIKDIVLNHIGSKHWWINDLPSADWLSFEAQFVPTRHARTAVSDPYAATVDKENFTAGWFTETMPDMNQRNPLVANYQIQNTLWWVEYAGLIGLRVDTYGYSDTDFLAQWSKRIMQEYPNLNVVGEEWSDNPTVVAYWLRGAKNLDGYQSALPSAMDFPLHGVLRNALVMPEADHSGLAALYEALVNDRLYPEPANMVLFEGNHDTPRLFSVLNDDQALYRMAITYLLTMPRIPQLYYGTEIQMTSPKTRNDGAARLDFPGGWPGDRVNATTGLGLSAAQKQAQEFVRKLLNWRKTQPVIHNGSLKHFAPIDGTYVYFRYDGSQKIMVVLNKNVADTQLDLSRFREVLAANAVGTDVLTGQKLELGDILKVAGRSSLILQVQPR